MRDATTRRSESTQHNEPLGAGTGTTRREAWVRVRRRRPPALSLALDDRLRRAPNRTAGFPRAVWSGERSLLASGSPALANRLRAHYVKRSKKPPWSEILLASVPPDKPWGANPAPPPLARAA